MGLLRLHPETSLSLPPCDFPIWTFQHGNGRTTELLTYQLICSQGAQLKKESHTEVAPPFMKSDHHFGNILPGKAITKCSFENRPLYSRAKVCNRKTEFTHKKGR